MKMFGRNIRKALSNVWKQTLSTASTCADCTGTVSKYDRHILIYTGSGSESRWASHVEAERTGVPIISALGREMKRVSGQLGEIKIKVSAVDADPQQVDGSPPMNAMIFPGGARFAVTPDNVGHFVHNAVLEGAKSSDKSHQQSGSLRKLILVCVHGSRDKLCGTKGPALQVHTCKTSCKTDHTLHSHA